MRLNFPGIGILWKIICILYQVVGLKSIFITLVKYSKIVQIVLLKMIAEFLHNWIGGFSTEKLCVLENRKQSYVRDVLALT